MLNGQLRWPWSLVLLAASCSGAWAQPQAYRLPANTWVQTRPPQLPQLNRDWGTAVLDPDHDLILRWSGGHSAHGGTVDFFPTCCAVAGAQPAPEHHLDGVSLLPLLQQTGGLDRDALFWHYPHYTDRTTPYSSVRKDDWRLIEYFEGNRLELYNLKADAGEKVNLAPSQPDKARELHQILANWRKQVGAQVPVPK